MTWQHPRHAGIATYREHALSTGHEQHHFGDADFDPCGRLERLSGMIEQLRIGTAARLRKHDSGRSGRHDGRRSASA